MLSGTHFILSTRDAANSAHPVRCSTHGSRLRTPSLKTAYVARQRFHPQPRLLSRPCCATTVTTKLRPPISTQVITKLLWSYSVGLVMKLRPLGAQFPDTWWCEHCSVSWTMSELPRQQSRN